MESVLIGFPDETSPAVSQECVTCGQNNQLCSCSHEKPPTGSSECVTCGQNNQLLTNPATAIPVEHDNVIAKCTNGPPKPLWAKGKQFNECRSIPQKLIYCVSCCNFQGQFGCDAESECYICGEDNKRFADCCFSVNTCVNGGCLCCIPCFICCVQLHSSCVHENSLLICPKTYLY